MGAEDVNPRFLAANLAWCEATLRAALAQDEAADLGRRRDGAAAALEQLADPSRVPYFELAERHRLETTDSAILSLCLGCAMDEAIRELVARLTGRPGVTPELLRLLLAGGSHERALELVRPLVSGRSVLVAGRLIRCVADDAVAFHHVSLELTRAARDYLLDVDPGRRPYHGLVALPADVPLEPSQRACKDALVQLVAEYHRAVAERPEVILGGGVIRPGNALYLHGPEGCGVRELAEAVARAGSEHAVVIAGRTLQTQRFGELVREAFDVAIVRSVPVIFDELSDLEPSQVAAVLGLIEPMSPLALLCGTEDASDQLKGRVLSATSLEPPDEATRARVWGARLPAGVEIADDLDVEYLGQVYPYDHRTIAAAARLATVRALGSAGSSAIDQALAVSAAEAFVPTNMSTLARPTPARGTLADIILPPDDLAVLERIVGAGRSFERALADWGLGRRFSYGKCLTALFTGEPGTGKTYAAKIVASELGRKLFVINVDRIVSKWAGETEKNIHEVFASVGGLGGVLLFDEADSLFSKRVEVASSQDKWANMLTNCLLTEIEEYTGIVLLTSNKPKSIDKAFERRIMYTLKFELPDEEHRRKIWEYVASADVPLASDVDLDRLSGSFVLSGGEIKNAFLRAAFEAYSGGRSITMQHLAESCREEYAKKGKVVHGS